MNEEPPQKKIKLTLESYEEKRIHTISETGEETYVEHPTDEESFSRIVRLLKFKDDLKLPTIIKPPPPFPLLKTVDNLREALHQVDSLLQTLNFSRPEDANSIFEMNFVRRPEDTTTKRELYQNFIDKREHINLAQRILSNGASFLKERIDRDRRVFQQLYEQYSFQFRDFRNQGRTPVIELAFKNTCLPSFNHVPVTIIRKKNNELEYCLPPICSSGKEIIICSEIMKEHLSIKQILQKAQDGVFNAELFHTLVNSLLSSNDIIHYQENEIAFKLGYDNILKFKLNHDDIFINLGVECTDCDAEFIHLLMKECLLIIHEEVSKNPTHLALPRSRKNSKIFSKVISFIKHRCFCSFLIKELENFTKNLEISFNVISTRFKNQTMIHVKLFKSKVFYKR